MNGCLLGVGLGALLGLVGCVSTPVGSRAEPRDFAPLRQRLDALKGWQREVLREGSVEVLALVSPPVKGRDRRKRVVLSGGVHGDEPAGVYALVEFLEQRAARYAQTHRFFVFPCVNCRGFEADVAEGERGHNVNRQFKSGSLSPEAALVMKQMAVWGGRFLFAMDMHEIPPYWEGEGFRAADNPREAYLYETQPHRDRRIGRTMIERLPSQIEVCSWPTIYGDRARGGLVSYPEDNGNAVYAEATTLDGYLQGRFTDHTFTTETPRGWPLEKRVQAHLSWLETALEIL